MTSRLTRGAFLIVAVLFPLFLHAQIVQVTLKDGTTVTGELMSYRDRAYVLMIGGREQTIDEAHVLDVKLISGDHPTPPPPSTDATTLLATSVEQLRQMHQRGQVEQAIQLIGTLFRDYPEKIARIREEQKELILAIHTEYLKRLILNQNILFITNELVLILSTLPESDAAALFKIAWEELKRLQDQDPWSPFATQWLVAMARLCEEQPFLKSRQQELSEMMVKTGLRHLSGPHSAQALKLLEDTASLYPEVTAQVRDPLFGARVALAEESRKQSDFAAALSYYSEALKLNPGHAETLAKVQDTIAARLKADLALKKDLPSQKELIEQTLSQLTSGPHREWAERQLVEITAAIAKEVGPAHQHLNKYFPVQQGLWHRYQSQDGDTTEKIQVDTVVPSGDGLKVYMSQEKTNKSYVTSQTFQIEVDQTRVYKNNRSDVLLKFPVTEGDSWEWKDGNSFFKRTYRSTSAAVATKAGTFENCVVVEFTSRAIFPDQPPITITSYSYYAPNVGMVKLELLEPEYQKKYSMELIEYGTSQPR